MDSGQVNPMCHEDDVLAPHTAVTSRDLKSNDDCVAPAHVLSQEEQDESQEQDGGIAIVKIGPGQRLKRKTAAHMGISKEHAKWCPAVAVATYRFWLAVITTNDEVCNTLTMEQKA